MKILFTDLQEKEHELEAVEGWRLMEIIRDYGFPIKAECGGACLCATCHVYIDDAWLKRIPPAREDEQHMLEELPDLKANSRLSCQIILNETLDGLKVKLAKIHN